MIRITPDTPPATINGVKLCAHCKHARRDPYRAPTYPSKKDVVCTLYKRVDLVTGVPVYDSAYDVRVDEQACGMSGRLFEVEHVPDESSGRSSPAASSSSSPSHRINEDGTASASDAAHTENIESTQCEGGGCSI